MPDAPQLQMWLTWCELTKGPRGTLDEFRTLVGKYQPSAIFIACAKLSIGLNYGPDAEIAANESVTARWIPILFPSSLVPLVRAYAAQGRAIFFQGQLRMLVTAAMRLNAAPESPAFGENNEFGELLLRAGEMLYKPYGRLEDDLDEKANLIATFLPIYELGLPTDPIMLFLRFYIFLTINIPRLPDSVRTFDVSALFEEQFGFSLKLYCEFILAFINHGMIERNKKPDEGPIDGAVRLSWFQKTNLAEETIIKMFNTVCFDLTDLPDTRASVGYADFEFLRDHPYFKHNEELYCLDYEYAVSKLESGALWRVLNNLDAKKKEPYLGFWGNVFEDYVAWLFETYADPSLSKAYPSPMYQHVKNKSICDLVVICGSTAVLIEAKLGTCRTDIRYAGDYKTMRKYLEGKLVSGTDRPVGVAQLLTAVRTLVGLAEGSRPVWMSGIKKLMPVILTKDEIGSSWVVNSYLNTRFADQLKDEDHVGYEVSPLVSLNVSCLERCAHALKHVPFSEVLEDRIKNDEKLGMPFDAASSFVPTGTARNVYKHLEILKAISEELIVDFGMREE